MSELLRKSISNEDGVQVFLTSGADREGVYVTVQAWGTKTIYGDLWDVVV